MVLVAGLLGLMAGGALAGVVLLAIHERREFARQDAREAAAEEREERAKVRHSELWKALADNRALTLAAVNQRARLELQVAALEVANNDHADNLAALGVRSPARVRIGGT